MTARANVSLLVVGGWGFSPKILEKITAELLPRARITLLDANLASSQERFLAEESAETMIYDAVIAWSLGAMLVCHAILRARLSARSVILFSATPSFVARDGWEHGSEASEVRALKLGLRRDRGAVLNSFSARVLSGVQHPKSESISEFFSEAETAELAQGLDVLAELDLREVAATIDTRTLVVHGCDDLVIPVQAGETFSRLVPKGRFLPVSGGSHAFFLENTRSWIGDCGRFLDSCF